ncbi:MAG: hypothetical protein ABW173_09735 [Sphingomonas sp.]
MNDMQAYWIAAAVCAVLAVTAASAERRRARRRAFDRIGWVPWSGLVMTALFLGVICVALAVHG